MPQASANRQQTSEAQSRFVVSLPKEVGTQIDALIKQTADQLREQIGMGVEITRPQMVQSLVQDALAKHAERAAAKES